MNFKNKLEEKPGYWLGLGFIFLALFIGPLRLQRTGLSISTSLLLALSIISFVSCLYQKELNKLHASGIAISVLLILYVLVESPYYANSNLILIFIIAFFLAYYLRQLYLPALITVFSIFLAAVAFYSGTKGGLIFSDDHPCFLYRLIQLKEHFPNIPFYNPQWNAGVEAREFFASGILNFFIIFSPLVYFFNIEKIYTLLVFCLLFLVFPGSLYFASRNFKFDRYQTYLVLTLGVCHSLFWYRWGLSYGTIGFITSMALMPLNLSLLARCSQQPNIKLLIVTAVCLSLMFLWSLSLVLFFPIILYCFITSSNKSKLLVLALFLVLINSYWFSVFYQSSKVGKFITASQTDFDQSKFKKNSDLPYRELIIEKIRKNTLVINPLVLLCGIAGLIVLSNNKLITVAISSAAFLGYFISVLKPQLELERMILAMSILLCFPAARYISELRPARVPNAILMGLIFINPLWTYNVASNNSSENYTLANDIVYKLSAEISKHGGNGRTLFSGFILHELNGGHVAPLAHWTKKPLIASSYQHDKWNYSDVIPEYYRKQKQEGVLEYLNLMNVSTVVAHDRFWRKWFKSRPDLFENVSNVEKFSIFRVINPANNYFVEGSGEILSQESGTIKLTLNSSSAIIKFNYVDILECDQCDLISRKYEGGVNFIELKNCPSGKSISIKMKSALKRLFN